MPHNFAPAAPDESIVHGACRPGYGSPDPGKDVEDWIDFMQDQGIERVCCLLDEKTARYDGLLASYENRFGAESVCHTPVTDYTPIDEQAFYEEVLPFLRTADDRDEPAVVHCSAGIGRTGHVLVGWLVVERDYSLGEAIERVEATGRNPTEAPSVTEESLRDLFADPPSR